jgi:AcrR family transcriptional regulator
VNRGRGKKIVRLGREQRVADILGAAREVFCEKGYEAAGVAEIAVRLGIVEGTIYKYFDSKRELLLRVLEHWYEQMFGDYERDLAGVAGARTRLRLLIWRHLRSIRDYPLLCRLMFREVRGEQDYPGSSLHARNRRYTRYLVEVIEAGVAAGEFRADIPAALLRDLVYGGIEHHAWNTICGRGTLDIDRVADQITAVLCEGIVERPAMERIGRETQRLSKIVDRMERKLSQQTKKPVHTKPAP